MLSAGPRRAGPGGLLEIFGWAYMVTIVGIQRGWETMPGWALSLPETRARSREYLVEVETDFVVLSPPSGSWDRTRWHNQRTPWRMRELHRKKAQARAVLVFVKKLCVISIVVVERWFWRTQRGHCCGNKLQSRVQ